MLKAFRQPRVNVSSALGAVLASACSRAASDISPESNLIDLGVDSLVLLSVMSQLELRLDLRLSEEDAATIVQMTTVAEIVALLETRIRQASKEPA